MHDLATIKRLNRDPSNNRQDKPASQPRVMESLGYAASANIAVQTFLREMQSPAMEREPLDQPCRS